MNKDYLVGVISQFENGGQPLPDHLKAKLHQIKSNIDTMTQDQFDLLSNGAVRVSPAIESNVEQNPLSDLREVYSELETMALSNRENSDLHRAITQLRGILDMPDRYYP
ncbi:hypothetical protein [Ammoniphilus sp. YIM 78166]|uniref:hypothetical protein n=1 Tax=Ammoniphilus sp. YIM 78166 TaxID=1644106 RepID=UPI0010702366|nr:hypothetical protein [Ammoniphilus sp. YIM 78166]